MGGASRPAGRGLDPRPDRPGAALVGGGAGSAALPGSARALQPDVRTLPAGRVTDGGQVTGKVLTMAEAVARFVPDGAVVAMGTALEAAIPFAAGHELIRQGRRDLTLVGPISDALFDQLIGAGCVARVCAAWVGNVSEGLGHCYRRAAERGEPRPIEIRDHSNFSISLALWAGAWGSPYIPTRTLLGSDIPRTNPDLEVGDGVVRVRALRPDVTVLHAQRADRDGRAHLWGPLGVSEEPGLAGRRVIVCCEELVEPEVTLSDPN